MRLRPAQKHVFAAVISGALAGFAPTALQALEVTPLIHDVERFGWAHARAWTGDAGRSPSRPPVRAKPR